jgi:hypothetical protein
VVDLDETSLNPCGFSVPLKKTLRIEIPPQRFGEPLDCIRKCISSNIENHNGASRKKGEGRE